MRDKQTNDEQVKIELLSQWTLEAEFRNYAANADYADADAADFDQE